MTRRLTIKEKKEIVKGFVNGNSIDFLSKLYNCTQLTITRNLKKNLGELKYHDLKNKQKSLQGKSNSKDIEFDNYPNKKIEENQNEKDSRKLNNSKNYDTLLSSSHLEPFFEIAPLDYQIENSTRKELSSVPIAEIDFPKILYMIVDKKIELEIKLLKDFPNWEFLPNEDLNRKTIEIHYDLNQAKRSCGKDQKVIKVPNTNVFKIVAPTLIARGISRIVFAERLIAL